MVPAARTPAVQATVPPLRVGQDRAADAPAATRTAGAIAFIWGVALFLPYPALPIGANTGLQLGHFLILALVPLAVLYRHWIAGAWAAALLLIVPQVVGLFVTGLKPIDLNATVLQIFAMLALPVTALAFRARPRSFLKGVSVMLGVHGLFGLAQWWSYRSDQFLLPGLFVNPSFAPFDDKQVQIYALYIQRPFGITPEPSALMTLVMPWVLLLLLAHLDGSTRRGQPFFRLDGWRAIGLVALLLTMLASASGGIPFFGAALAALVLIRAWRDARLHPQRAIAMVAAVVGIAIAAGVVVLRRYASEASQLGSWDERATSLGIGFRLIANAEPLQLLFGYGGGQVARIADSLQSTSAVHSWVLTYVVSFGILGTLGLVVALLLVARGAWRSRDPLVWTIILGLWLIGPTLMSGYYQLLGVWGFLALPLALSATDGRSAPPRRLHG